MQQMPAIKPMRRILQMTDAEAKQILALIAEEISKCEAPTDYTFLEKSAYVKALYDVAGCAGRALAAYLNNLK